MIDYALEFKNYKFLKYLMDRGHIAFVCEGPFGYYKSFGAKTDIERKPAWKDQNLEQKVRNNDSFRRRLISLAIENNDNSVLAKLKAREIPDLYHADHMSVVMPNCGEYYDEKMLKRIASLDESALDYFWEHFKIQTWCKKSYTFLFPYIDTLVEMMIENGHSCCDMALEKCYEHNLGVREQLQKMSAADCEAGCDGFFDSDARKEQLLKDRYKYLYINEEGNMVAYTGLCRFDGFVTNLIQINAESDNKYINRLIQKINDLYDWVSERATVHEERR